MAFAVLLIIDLTEKNAKIKFIADFNLLTLFVFVGANKYNGSVTLVGDIPCIVMPAAVELLLYRKRAAKSKVEIPPRGAAEDAGGRADIIPVVIEFSATAHGGKLTLLRSAGVIER